MSGQNAAMLFALVLAMVAGAILQASLAMPGASTKWLDQDAVDSTDRLKRWVEIAAHVATILAIVVGGWWTYTKFIEAKEGDWSVNLTVETDQIELKDNKTLIVFNVHLKNTGKVAAIADLDRGCTLEVFEHRNPQCENTTDVSQVKTKFFTQPLIDWDPDHQQANGITKIVDFNMLSRYQERNKDGKLVNKLISFNPGDEHHESEALIANKDVLYGYIVKFWGFKEGKTTAFPRRFNSQCGFVRAGAISTQAAISANTAIQPSDVTTPIPAAIPNNLGQ